MKQTQKIKTPIPHGSHVDYCASHHETDRLAGADNDFVGLCVRQTWVLLVGKTIAGPAPTPILSVHVRLPLGFLDIPCDVTYPFVAFLTS
jgi:hypothetical protein